MLSFVGGKGCFGGNVDMGGDASGGSMSGGTGGDGMGVAGNGMGTSGSGMGVAGNGMGTAGVGAGGSGMGTAGTGMGTAGAGAGGNNLTEHLLNVDSNGIIAGPLGASGPFYAFADSAGNNGAPPGDCQNAGHATVECAQVSTPALGSGFPNVAGAMCTSGTVERILGLTGMMGCPSDSSACDFASMWGAGVGFNLSQMGDTRSPYDAASAGVIGIAFDIDQVPADGLRVMFPMPATVNDAHAWQPSMASSTSPVMAGHNRILFTELQQPAYVQNQVPFDPSQLLSVQFLIPTSPSSGPSPFQFCLSNVALITGESQGACPGGVPMQTGYQYSPAGMCLTGVTTQLSCPPPAGTTTQTVPAQPAVAGLPCVHRIADGALFVALENAMSAGDWRTLADTNWARLSPGEYLDCTAQEAELVANAPVCAIPL